MREFAEHMAADVKQLVEDEATGAKAYRYVRTGTDHYSLAFTYDCVAWSRESAVVYMGTGFRYDEQEHMANSILNWRF